MCLVCELENALELLLNILVVSINKFVLLLLDVFYILDNTMDFLVLAFRLLKIVLNIHLNLYDDDSLNVDLVCLQC
jgi:hypothetical protein